MKRLLILRHAEAVPKSAAEDRARVLSARGRTEMAEVARHLASAEGGGPQLALVSPAARTRETWSLAGLPHVPARFDERIYEASSDELLAVVQSADPPCGTVILVGHNPGLHDLALSLLGPDRGADTVRLDEFPTACLATLDLDVDDWRRAAPEVARLVDFVTPASLGA